MVQLNASQRIVWVTHNFQFLGGSLGSSEGEKITKSFEYGLANKIPVVVQCKTGGARMQEGIQLTFIYLLSFTHTYSSVI